MLIVALTGANAAAPWEGGRPRPPFREIANATFAARKMAGEDARPPRQRESRKATADGAEWRAQRSLKTYRSRKALRNLPTGSCALSKARKAGSFSYRDCTAPGDMVNILPQCGRG